MVYAQVDFSKKSVFKPAVFGDIATLMNVILPLLTLGAALIFLIMCLLAAFHIITGGDNAEKIKKAQQSLLYAGLGLIVVLSSFLLVKLLGFVLGVKNIIPL